MVLPVFMTDTRIRHIWDMELFGGETRGFSFDAAAPPRSPFDAEIWDERLRAFDNQKEQNLERKAPCACNEYLSDYNASAKPFSDTIDRNKRRVSNLRRTCQGVVSSQDRFPDLGIIRETCLLRSSENPKQCTSQVRLGVRPASASKWVATPVSSEPK